MQDFVLCPCCNRPIPINEEDIGLTVTCPRTKRLVSVRLSGMKAAAPAPRPSPPPGKSPVRGVVLLCGICLLIGVGVFVAERNKARPEARVTVVPPPIAIPEPDPVPPAPVEKLPPVKEPPKTKEKPPLVPEATPPVSPPPLSPKLDPPPVAPKPEPIPPPRPVVKKALPPGSRTFEEIRETLAKINAPTPDETERALHRLQSYRYLAGVPYRDLRLSEEFNTLATAASKVCKKLGRLDHNPMNPGLPEDEYQLGLRGTRSSNLGQGYRDMAHSVDGYMDDSDDRNIAKIGHRRWCLNPPMQNVGFGRVDEFTAMYSFDNSGRFPDYDFVCWPPKGLIPANYFGGRHAWNVSLNPARYKKCTDSVAVTIHRTDAEGGRIGEALALNFKGVDGEGFGIDNCVIFRPRSVSLAKGARYRVLIDNLETKAGAKTSIEYDVEFCAPAEK